VIMAAVVSPLLVMGFTLENILFWSIHGIISTLPTYILAMDWVYVFGSCFLGKIHLDLQADYLLSKMECLLKEDSVINDRDVVYLVLWYKRFAYRVRKFNEFYRPLMSPYRCVMSYFTAVAVYIANQMDN